MKQGSHGQGEIREKTHFFFSEKSGNFTFGFSFVWGWRFPGNEGVSKELISVASLLFCCPRICLEWSVKIGLKSVKSQGNVRKLFLFQRIPL